MIARATRRTPIVTLLLLVLASRCALVKGGGDAKEKDPATHEMTATEQQMDERGVSPESPIVELGADGFGESRLGRVGDALAEGLVLAGLAALVSGVVYLFKHRLPLLGFLASALALLLALLAFLKSWG